MSEAFERETGIEVLMTRRSFGETFAQLAAEDEQLRGDVWWGGTGEDEAFAYLAELHNKISQ